MVGVGFKSDQPVLGQIIDDPLHVLPMGAKISREPCDGLGIVRSNDRAEDLPTRARQSEGRNQPIPGGQKLIVQPEEVENERGHGVSGGGPFELGHFTPWIAIDIVVSTAI